MHLLCKNLFLPFLGGISISNAYSLYLPLNEYSSNWPFSIWRRNATVKIKIFIAFLLCQSWKKRGKTVVVSRILSSKLSKIFVHLWNFENSASVKMLILIIKCRISNRNLQYYPNVIFPDSSNWDALLNHNITAALPTHNKVEKPVLWFLHCLHSIYGLNLTSLYTFSTCRSYFQNLSNAFRDWHDMHAKLCQGNSVK